MKLPLDRFIFLSQAMPPYIGTKNVYYEDPVFKPRLFPPAFTTREEAVKQAASTIKKIKKRRWFDAHKAPETRDLEMDDDEIAAMYEKLAGVLGEDENSAGLAGDTAHGEDAEAEDGYL